VKFVSSQPQYSALYRAPEAEVFPLCAEHGISQIVWSPLAQGVLTGKYKPGVAPREGSRATSSEMGRFIGAFMRRDTLERVQRFVQVAEEAGHTPSQLALAWVLRTSDVSAAIIGASRPSQVFENAKAAEIELSADTLAAIEAALAPAQSSLF
jgi:aryl-alcohol dehydrogenase-like predicted oxidoreductase